MGEQPLSKILVGWDGSPRAADALALARTISAATGAAIILACAKERGVDPAVVLGAGERLLPYGARADLRALEGRSPAAALAQLAQAENADLVVLGASRRTGLRLATLGSVADGLVHRGGCAVAIAPAGLADERDLGIRVIGVAFDGSDEAHRALRVAEALAVRASATIRLFGVQEPLAPTAVGISAGVAYADPPGAARERLWTALVEAADSLEPRVRPRVSVRSGAAAEELAEYSAAVDLLVTGSRGRGAMGRTLLGSVSSAIGRRPASPLLVVPRARRRAEQAATAAV